MSLRLDQLSFGYATGPLFKAINLDLGQGQLTCLAGPNASGKSSLLKAVLGILPLQDGSVTWHGRQISGLPRAKLAKLLAYVPQHTPLAAISVAEAVMIGRTPYLSFLPGKADQQAVRNALASLGLLNWLERRYDELSGGERRLVLIARALAQETPILLLDEPAAGLDVKFQHQVYTVLHNLAQTQGKTILIAEHDLNLAARYSQSLALLFQGGILAHGLPAQVLRPEVLGKVYQVHSQVLELDGVKHIVTSPLEA